MAMVPLGPGWQESDEERAARLKYLEEERRRTAAAKEIGVWRAHPSQLNRGPAYVRHDQLRREGKIPWVDPPWEGMRRKRGRGVPGGMGGNTGFGLEPEFRNMEEPEPVGTRIVGEGPKYAYNPRTDLWRDA